MHYSTAKMNSSTADLNFKNMNVKFQENEAQGTILFSQIFLTCAKHNRLTTAV